MKSLYARNRRACTGLIARPRGGGPRYATKRLKFPGLTKAMKALHLSEPQIAGIRERLEEAGGVHRVAGAGIRKIFTVPELVEAGFEETSPE